MNMLMVKFYKGNTYRNHHFYPPTPRYYSIDFSFKTSLESFSLFIHMSLAPTHCPTHPVMASSSISLNKIDFCTTSDIFNQKNKFTWPGRSVVLWTAAAFDDTSMVIHFPGSGLYLLHLFFRFVFMSKFRKALTSLISTLFPEYKWKQGDQRNRRQLHIKRFMGEVSCCN